MYKKIKNGSFMNWIWFIICLLPLLFIFIDLNNDENKTQTIENLSILNYRNEYTDRIEIYTESDTSDLFYTNYIDNYYDFTNNGNNALDFQIDVYPKQGFNLYNYFAVMPLYNDIDDEPTIVDNANFQITINDSLNNELFHYNYENTKIALFNFVFNTSDNVDNIITFNVHISRGASLGVQGFRVYYFGSDKEFEIDLILENNFVVQTKPNFYWFNKFTSNGFISNAFLNLSSLFGVNNVYYSLACYYIEYLLVIVLLHLAFDVLYMLPNICHKFMEKIGGERD